MRTTKKKLLSVILTLVMLLSMMPMAVLAAPAKDLPANMADSPILRALEYTGYDVQKQKNDGTLYQSGHYGRYVSEDILSGITYGTGPSGKETVADSSTPTGKAPDMAKFQKQGLCCAAFVTYYLYNYLPNVEGADMDYIIDAVDAVGTSTQSTTTWKNALNSLVKKGIVELIGTSSSNVDRKKLTPGDVIIFGNAASDTAHSAIYSGTYDGMDFMIHVGNDRGPEIMPVQWMGSSSAGDKASYPNAYYHLPEVSAAGAIEVYKKDTDGKALAGAYFTATSTTDASLQYIIGPTNSNGYASTDGVLFSTYTVKETVFPAGYRGYGKTEWKVTLDKNTPDGTITINAINEQIPGNCEIIKNAEDGKVDGLTFRITGNGVDKTATTKDGKILFSDLKPGTYQIHETTPELYEPQTVKTVTVVSGQTAKVTFSNTLKKGSVTVTKDAEDGLEMGAKFHLYGTTDSGIVIDEYATVGADKKAYFTDIPIGSRLTLEEVEVASRYVLPDAVRVDVKWNEVTQVTVENILRKGTLHVTKDAEDGLPEGSRFHLYGVSDSGVAVDMYATADKDGNVWFRDIPISTKLTLEEVDVAARYIIPDKETVSVLWNEVTEITVKNILKKWRADVFKVDAEIAGTSGDTEPDSLQNGESQGEATLEGAQYGIFKGGVLVDTYTTDENGWFITDYYPCGDDWTLRELESSPGYLLDPTVYTIPSDASQYSVELNTERIDVYEDVIKGKLSLLKRTDDGFTETEIPEAGASFEVFLKSAGSYQAAKPTERGVLVCDENGRAEITLPYGVYTVKQTWGWEGKKSLAPFDVHIREDGQEYFFALNNLTIKGNILLHKIDADSGEALAGVEFGLFDMTGKELMRGTTGEDGTLLFEGVCYGRVEIRELTVKTGYVKNEDSIVVDITEDGVTLSYEMTNKKIPPAPEEPESPKTGDDSLGILLLVALVALIALGYLVMNARNSKNMIKKEG